MASDYLTTSGISSLVDSFTASETSKIVTPLTTKKDNLQKLSSSYSVIQTKITSLKSILSDLISTSSSGVLYSKTASSSDSSFVTATASGSASTSSYDIRISQLAKSDIAISNDLTSANAYGLTGTHTFVVKTGDGSGGDITSHVSVTFDGTETTAQALTKIQSAVLNNKGTVTSSSFAGTTAYTGGPSTLSFDVNGTATSVSITGGGTYSDLIDEMVSKINSQVSGLSASKVTDGSGNVQLSVTVKNNANYVSISNTSGFDLGTNLNITTTKERSAAGSVNVSVFSPMTSISQLSITSNNTGSGYRITDLVDTNGGSVLTSLGLNLGTTRPSYVQSGTGSDTPGYRYADTTVTNNLMDARFTFNGLSLQRNSNTVSDLATGLSFTLKSVMTVSDPDTTVSVSTDSATIKSKLNSFITSFNDLYSYLKTNSSYSSGTRGFLTGDSTASALISFMSSVSYGEVTGLNTDALKTLSQIGISFDPTSGLSITDPTTLDNELSSNASQVADLFNSTNGVASKLYNYVSPYLGAGGYLDKSISNLNTNITRVSDSITAAQTQIDKRAEALRYQYEQLQVQLSSLIMLQTNLTNSGL